MRRENHNITAATYRSSTSTIKNICNDNKCTSFRTAIVLIRKYFMISTLFYWWCSGHLAKFLADHGESSVIAVGGAVNTLYFNSSQHSRHPPRLRLLQPEAPVMFEDYDLISQEGHHTTKKMPYLDEWLNSNRTTLFTPISKRQLYWQLMQSSKMRKAPGLTILAAPWEYAFCTNSIDWQNIKKLGRTICLMRQRTSIDIWHEMGYKSSFLRSMRIKSWYRRNCQSSSGNIPSGHHHYMKQISWCDTKTTPRGTNWWLYSLSGRCPSNNNRGMGLRVWESQSFIIAPYRS